MGGAERHGYDIDKKWFAETARNAFGGREQMIAAKLIPGPKDPPDPRPEGNGVRMGLVFMAIAAETFEAPSAGQKLCLQAVADNIVTTQHKDGSWNFLDDRPPIHESRASDAAWIMFALGGLAHSQPTPAERAVMEKGTAWLEQTRLADSHQGKVLKVLLAIRAGKSREQIRAALDELLALQQADGGWRQKADMASDAYATGQTMYVLSLAGYSAEQSEKIRPQIKRAIEFLVATQKADGSWPMVSRAKPGGKPAKLLTPITCAATSWATLGLVRCVPQK
jgi:rhamnogalacturonyl hydrolase YesR